MNPLQHRLASLRHRLVLVNLWRGMCSVLAVAVGALLIEGLADYWLHLPSVLRALCLVGSIGATLSVAMLFLIVPLTRRHDDLTLALKVEEVYPELNDLLGSSVQFLDEPEENLPGSKVLRQRAIELAEKRSANCDFNIILDRRGVFLVAIAAAVVGLTAGYFGYCESKSSWTALCRLGVPFGGFTWTELNLPEPPLHRVGQGRPFVIRGSLSGIKVADAYIDIDGIIKAKDMKVPVTWPDGKDNGEFVKPLDMSQKGIGQFSFRVTAGDAIFPADGSRFKVDILPPPRLTKLNDLPSPQIELTYPAYTGLQSPKPLSPGQGHVDAVAGTRISWKAAIDRKVTEAWLKLDLQKSEVGGQKSEVGGRKADPPTSDFRPLTSDLRIPCKIDPSGTVLSAEFTPLMSGTYEVHFKDADGLENEYKNELRMFVDPPPTVQLRRPATSQMLLPEAEVNFQVLVDDEIFAVRSVWLEFRRKNADGWLDTQPQTQVWVEPSADRPQHLDLPRLWPLANRFKEGETVVLHVCADDFNDLVNPKLIGRSHDIELQIIGKDKLNEIVNEAFQKIQQDVVRQAIEQDKAKALVEEAMDKKLPLNARHEKLVEAEAKQRQIQDAVGPTPDDGIRKDVADLKALMDANKMPPSQLKDLAATVASELERLARTDLDQIEPALTQARRQMIGDPKAENKKSDDKKPDDKKPDDKKPEAKKSDPLEDAKAHQEEAKKTLDELVKFLGPWASVNDVNQMTRAIQNEQKNVKNETEALKAKVGKMTPDQAAGDESLAAEMKITADKQQGLEKKVNDLVKTIADAIKNQKDSEAAAKLKEAAKVAKDEKLKEKMSDLPELVNRANKLESAGTEQQNVVGSLQKMLDALGQQNREKEVEGLRKKIKTAEQKIDDLKQEMKQLTDKMKKARNIANPEEKAAEMKKLGEEQKKLEEKLQEESRELSRLRADRPSRDLAQAKEELNKAGKKMQNGEDPEPDLKDAEKRMKQAEEDLKQADQELAREQQEQVAERIKGLKERQDAALVASEKLHSDLLSKKNWSRGMLSSLKNSAGSQTNLAQEADNVKEKLKESQVFAYILNKANKAMTQAAEAIKVRMETSVERGTEPLDKDDLAEENKAQDKIVKLQKEASEQLGSLLEALQPDEPQAQNPMDPGKEGDQPKKKPEDDDKPEKKPPQLPSRAEIKALIDIQEKLMKRTMDFDARCPDRTKLNPDQQAELRALENEQTDVQSLFRNQKNEDKEKGDDK